LPNVPCSMPIRSLPRHLAYSSLLPILPIPLLGEFVLSIFNPLGLRQHRMHAPWKFLGPLCVSLMLVVSGPAYGDPDYVSFVKNSYLPRIDKTITVGDALDTYKYFSRTEWKSHTTDQGRNIVEFVGIFNKKKIIEYCRSINSSYIEYPLPESK